MKWHKISEEWPDYDKDVLVYVKNKYINICYLSSHHDTEDQKWYKHGGGWYSLEYFTHWAEIKPPEDAECGNEDNNKDTSNE